MGFGAASRVPTAEPSVVNRTVDEDAVSE